MVHISAVLPGAVSLLYSVCTPVQTWLATPLRFVLAVGSGTSPEAIGRVLVNQQSRKFNQQLGTQGAV